MARGVKFGPKPKISTKQRKHVLELIERGKTYSEITEITGISRAMIYLIKKPEKAKQFNEQHKLRLAGQRNRQLKGEEK
jgi:DNA invertase Pin-like site-specific DNA recombinase